MARLHGGASGVGCGADARGASLSRVERGAARRCHPGGRHPAIRDIWTSTVLELRHPGQTYLRAAGSLGWSLPGRARSQGRGHPTGPSSASPVTAASTTTCRNWKTAQRRGLPVVVVVNNNSGFGQGVDKVRDIYGDTPGNPDDLNRFQRHELRRRRPRVRCRGHPGRAGPAKSDRPSNVRFPLTSPCWLTS